ncbi:hypothetical protein F5146DRAFT_1009582 [Armillaria mellea]|nr:hypothetical protein F5146DRAFT_1009582 [Armillaria mellea]
MENSASTSKFLRPSVSPSNCESTPSVEDSTDDVNAVNSFPGKGKKNAALLNLIVQSNTGDEKAFRLKNTTPLGRVFRAFACSSGKDVESLRFIYEGERINALKMPAMYGMADGDIIDIMIECKNWRHQIYDCNTRPSDVKWEHMRKL